MIKLISRLSVVSRLLMLPAALLACRRARTGGRQAEHPLAHQRRPRPAHGLLRRPVCVHASCRPAGRAGDDLRTRLVERPRLRSGADRSDLGNVPDEPGRRAHAQHGARCPWARRCSRSSSARPATTARTTARPTTTLWSPGRSGTSRRARHTGRTASRASRSSRSSTRPRATKARSAFARTGRCTTPPRSGSRLTTPTPPRLARTGRNTTTA